MIRLLIVTLLAVTLLTASARAQWPQWGGPTRDFRAPAGRLAASWKERGPRTLWSRDLGNGTSGIAVDDGTLYTMAGSGRAERVVALDAKTGKKLWEHGYKVRYQASNPAYGGPHATPLVMGGRIFTAGCDGKVHGLDRGGKKLWMRDLVSEFRADIPQSGYAASPVGWRDLVILPGSGGPGSAAVAFRQKDGTTVWARHGFLSSHASPLLITVDGTDHVVFHGMNRLVGLDPATGDLLWQLRLRRNAIDNVAVSPAWDAQRRLFFVSHAYDGRGTRAVRLTKVEGTWRAEQAWNSGRLKVEHGNLCLLDDGIYGSDRSEPAFTVGLGVERGRRLFKERGISKATFLSADKKLLILEAEGILHLARGGAEGLEILGSHDVLTANAWTVPTLVGRRVYLRDRLRILALELP